MKKTLLPLFVLAVSISLYGVVASPKPFTITLEDGRRTVELITAIYRSNRDKKPIKFPLVPEHGTDYDGRYLRREQR